MQQLQVSSVRHSLQLHINKNSQHRGLQQRRAHGCHAQESRQHTFLCIVTTQECFAMLQPGLPTADVSRPAAGQLACTTTFASLHWNQNLLFAYGLM